MSMSSLSKTLSVCTLLTLSLGAPALATEYYVKAGASGKGTSKEDAAPVLAPILAAAERGDVIHVAEGEYYGRLDAGEFAINVPELTLVGGYTGDFASRDPFKHPTILRRKPGVKANYTQVLGGIVGCDPDAHGIGQKVGASGLILDGFYIDGTTRNVYSGPGPRLGQQGSWKEPLIKLVTSDFHMTTDVKIRNCVFLNGYYQGIYVKWQGAGNEVTNCLFVNCSITGIDGTGAVVFAGGVDPRVLVKNNTVTCFYSHDKAQLAHGVSVGAKGRMDVQDNVFAYLQAPANGVASGRGGSCSITGNVFWFTSDADAIIKAQNEAGIGAGGGDEEEEEEEEAPKKGSGLTGNVKQDPGFEINADFFNTLSTYGIIFGKFPVADMNAKRKELGLNDDLKTGGNTGGPEWAAYMRPYPTEDWAAIPTHFVSKIAGKGIQLAGPFATYTQRASTLPGAVSAGKDEYEAVEWADLMDKSKLAALDGKKVKLKIGLDPRKEVWYLSDMGVTDMNYVSFVGRMPGKTSENLSEKISVYALLGTGAAQRYNEFGNKNVRKKSWKDGTWIRGVIYAKGQGKVPASIVIDYMGKVN